jgi:hypothetical protein
MEKLIHCHDGCLAPMIAIQNENGTWEIFGISEVFGMGSGDYKKRLFDFSFSDLIILNSMKGKAYVCLKKYSNWGLLELNDNKTIECDWRIISDFIYTTSEEMLSDYKINKLDFKPDPLTPRRPSAF